MPKITATQLIAKLDGTNTILGMGCWVGSSNKSLPMVSTVSGKGCIVVVAVGVAVNGARVTGGGSGEIVGDTVMGANVTGANVTGAKVTGAKVTGDKVTGAVVMGATVAGAVVVILLLSCPRLRRLWHSNSFGGSTDSSQIVSSIQSATDDTRAWTPISAMIKNNVGW